MNILEESVILNMLLNTKIRENFEKDHLEEHRPMVYFLPKVGDLRFSILLLGFFTQL